jgi:hypothetical protein
VAVRGKISDRDNRNQAMEANAADFPVFNVIFAVVSGTIPTSLKEETADSKPAYGTVEGSVGLQYAACRFTDSW